MISSIISIKMNSNQHQQPSPDDDDHDKDKMLPLTLSTTTAAEYGDLVSLAYRLNKQSKKSVVPSLLLQQKQQRQHQQQDSSPSSIDFVGISTNTLTPLHLAAQNGHAAITSYLLQNGYDADLGYTAVNNNTNTKNTHDNTNASPLHRACYSGSLSCIQLLLENGANDMAIDYSIGDEMTPLHKAVKGGRYLAVALLIYHFHQKQHKESKSQSLGQPCLHYLQSALEAKDKMNHTPIQLAHKLQSYGEDEILSLRRWDKVAGDTRADFDLCVLLLQYASSSMIHSSTKLESESSSTTLIFFHLQNEFGKVQSSLASSSLSSLSCNWENKEIIAWEEGLNKALMQFTSTFMKEITNKTREQQELEQTIIMNNHNCSKNSTSTIASKVYLQEEDGNDSNKNIVPPPANDKNSNTIHQNEHELEEISSEKNDLKQEVLGQACQACGVITLSLFRFRDGRLVCRKCMKNRKRHVL